MVLASSLSFLILSLIFSVLSICAANSNVYVQCSQLNFTSMTPYESSVNLLFASLVDSSSRYNFKKFETSPQSDVVYGLFQCRGDLSFPDCKACVANSISQLKTTCSTSRGGEIQLEECFVKYDDTSFFGAQDMMKVRTRCGPSIEYNLDVSNRKDGVLSYLVGENEQYFRRGDFGSAHGVAQCVQDLVLSDCQVCLSEASGQLKSECETSSWGDLYLRKCYIRYVVQGNENTVNDGNPVSNKSSGNGKKNDIPKWIGYILAALLGGGSFSIATKKCCSNSNRITLNNNNEIKALEKSLESSKKREEVEKKAKKTNKVKKDEENGKKNHGSRVLPLTEPFCDERGKNV